MDRRGDSGTGPVGNAYDRLAGTYDATYSDEVSASEDRRVLRLLTPEVRRARRVLDLGCGTGWVLDQMTSLLIPEQGGREYLGMDLSPGMLKELVAKHPGARTAWFDVNDWAPEVSSADLVTSTYASPSYVDDVALFAHQLHVTLSPGGRVFLMPHAMGNSARAPYLQVQDAYIGDRPWSERATHAAFEAAGFEEVRVLGMRHPTMGPGEHRSRRWHDLWLRAEGRAFRPDAMSFLIVTATARR